MREDRFHRSHCPRAMWLFLLLLCICTFFLLVDRDCEDGDPCTTNTCVGICMTSQIENCCQTNNDCTDTLCNQALCDVTKSRCVLQPYIDGVACDDQDVCTVNDGCTAGFCVGIPLNCTESQCQLCTCDPVLGCVYTDMMDGSSCEKDSCTISTCVSGQCSGESMDCTHLDDHCGLGQCVDGKCVHVPGTDGTLCDDSLHCTTSDHCESGTCVGVVRQCFDNDPCTQNKCIEEVGTCMNVPLVDEVCETVCVVDADCKTTFPWVNSIQCRDGSCVDIRDDPSTTITFTGYHIQQCFGLHYRMAMFFRIDTAVQDHNGLHYRIAHSPEHFSGSFPVGFPGEVVDIQSHPNGDYAKTTFTLHTQCKDLTDECYQFTNMYYAFSVLLHDCQYSSGWQYCLDDTSMVSMYFNLSVVDCPFREHIVQTQLYGNLEVESEIHSTLPMAVSLTITEGFDPWMTDIRICVPKQQHLEQCVLNTATQSCPNIGCFDWGDTETEALEVYWDLMIDGAMTAFAADTNINTCRFPEHYVLAEKCGKGFQGTCVTDGFTVTPLFLQDYIGHQVVIDVKFMGHFCGRRLQTGSSTKRELSVITILP